MALILLELVLHAGYIEEPIFFEVTAPEGHPVVRTPTCGRRDSSGRAMIPPHTSADQYDGGRREPAGWIEFLPPA
jgi:hypothetical protein